MRSISGIVLAAGAGRRFGGTKQLATIDGDPLVQRAIDALVGAGIEDLVVVVGHDAARVRAAVRLPAAGRVVENHRFADGQATSLAVGLASLGTASEAAIVLLADQPGITADHVRALIDGSGAGASAAPAPIVRLRFDDAPGPALLAREVWDEVARLEGDTGARAIAERTPERVGEVRVAGPAPRDVDTREDLAALGGSDAADAVEPD